MILIMLISALLPVIAASAAGYWPDSIEVASDAAIVMDADTGVILYAKDEHTPYYPASITKILTTLLAIENSSMDEIVTFSKDAVEKNEGKNSHISRDIGEKMTMEQCLYAVMLESANECAYAVGEHVAGDIGSFVDMMNDRAKELGCKNTHFNNANGLPDEDHYVSAYDMALIAREAFSDDTFQTITGTRAYSIPPTNTHNVPTPLNNHHAMINNYKTNAYLYEGCLGGKTGYTDAAGYTLVTYARRGDMTLVCVVLSSTQESYYTDTINLFNYCFDNFMFYPVAGQEDLFGKEAAKTGLLAENVNLVTVSEGSRIVLPKAAQVNHATYEVVPVKSKNRDVIGEIRYTYADHYVGKGELLYRTTDVEGYPFSNLEGEEEYLQIDILFVAIAVVSVTAAVIVFLRLRSWSSDEIVRRRRLHTEAKMMEFKGTVIKRNIDRRGRRRKR
ncbi:MAG: D-alanyl-D-alanine carboxypeptidase [Lachnospiraceae bacterium]|nr:D-alanyl-D-alanine carboxypeptidase [Lachnospiraceae bacterium]